MQKKLLKVLRSFQKRTDKLDDVLSDDFLSDEIDELWDLVAESYGIDMNIQDNDPAQVIGDFACGNMTLKEADERLKRIHSEQH